MSFGGAFGGGGDLFLADDGFEKEHRLQFLAPPSAGGDPILHVVFSGSVGAFSTKRSSDSADTHWNVVMVVGPFWASGGVKQVVPHVSIGRYQNTNADEDDEQAWEIMGLTWDTVNVPTTKNLFTTLEDRIRLLLQGMPLTHKARHPTGRVNSSPPPYRAYMPVCHDRLALRAALVLARKAQSGGRGVVSDGPRSSSQESPYRKCSERNWSRRGRCCRHLSGVSLT